MPVMTAGSARGGTPGDRLGFDLGVRLDENGGPACLLVYLLLAWGDRHDRG